MDQKNRFKQRLEDFEKAFKRLLSALKQGELKELEKDGVVQRFEFTFELAWKTLKDYLENQGFFDVSSPKKAVQKAFENGLIQNEDVWIDIQEDRNRMSHIYDQKENERIFENIQKKYVKELEELIFTLKKENQ